MLEIENLELTLSGTSIVNGLSFRVNDGEIHGVLGENGAGIDVISLPFFISGTS